MTDNTTLGDFNKHWVFHEVNFTARGAVQCDIACDWDTQRLVTGSRDAGERKGGRQAELCNVTRRFLGAQNDRLLLRCEVRKVIQGKEIGRFACCIFGIMAADAFESLREKLEAQGALLRGLVLLVVGDGPFRKGSFGAVREEGWGG